MRKLAAHLTAFTLLAAGSAVAADMRMPVKAPPPAPAPVAYNWTGCYIAGGGGYGLVDHEARHHDEWGRSNAEFDIGGRGWFGTVQGGCDYQIGSNWLIGVFGDYDFSDIKARVSLPLERMVGDSRHRNTWAVGGRVGWIPFQAPFLVYVAGGYTQADFDRTDFRHGITGEALGIHIDGHNPSGWFVASGYEYGLQWVLPGLFWKTEYRFADYGSDRQLFVDSWGRGQRVDSMDRHTFIQTIRSALVWRFNFGGYGAPVAARY